MQKLTATKRSKTDRLETIRNNGMVPAVIYGAKVENTSISVPSVAFAKLFKLAGESSTIELELDGKTTSCLIHDVQFDPIRGHATHVDFLAVDMNKKVEVTVPLEFTGVSQAEKDGLGSLVKVLHEVDIEALPKDLPHSISIDISVLVTLENQIHVSDIVLPTGVKMITDGHEVVALVAPAREEKEEVPVDLSAIEVEKKGKKEEVAEESK